MDRLERELANLRAALRWAVDTGEAEPALRLAGALWFFWDTRGHLREGQPWLETALALPAPDGTGQLRAAALNAAGWLALVDPVGVNQHVRLQWVEPRATAAAIVGLGHRTCHDPLAPAFELGLAGLAMVVLVDLLIVCLVGLFQIVDQKSRYGRDGSRSAPAHPFGRGLLEVVARLLDAAVPSAGMCRARVRIWGPAPQALARS